MFVKILHHKIPKLTIRLTPGPTHYPPAVSQSSHSLVAHRMNGPKPLCWIWDKQGIDGLECPATSDAEGRNQKDAI